MVVVSLDHFRDSARNVDRIPRLEPELQRILNGAELEALAVSSVWLI